MNKMLISTEPIKEKIKELILETFNNTTYFGGASVDVKVNIQNLIDEYIKDKQITEPSIYITASAYAKMRKIVDDMTSEIGWYGTVEKQEGLENTYVITDIIVYPQTVTGVTCEQDDDKMFEFEMSLTTEQVNHKRFHGHSHVNMQVTPSGVDEQFYNDILKQVTDYFIIAITNKRNDYTVRFYDVANNIVYTNLSIKVLTDDGLDLDAWFKEQSEQAVSKPVVKYSTLSTPTYSIGSTPVHTIRANNKKKTKKTAYYDPYSGEVLSKEEYMEWYGGL